MNDIIYEKIVVNFLHNVCYRKQVLYIFRNKLSVSITRDWGLRPLIEQDLTRLKIVDNKENS